MEKSHSSLKEKFIETICLSLSGISDDIMQAWIQSPRRLQTLLSDALFSVPVFRAIKLGNVLARWRALCVLCSEAGLILSLKIP
jgi:hypothetical protein